MSKKIYDLSLHTQIQDEQKVLKSETGKEYNVSFVPAIINRKYYKRWTEYQSEIINILPKFYEIKRKLESGIVITKEEQGLLDEFKQKSQDAAQAGLDLIVYVMHINGYETFDEDELLTNFSEAGIAFAINYIMGIESEDVKKKYSSKTKNS